MLKLEEGPEPPVHYFDQAHWGFGDKWAMCNYILRTSEDTRCKTLVSNHCWNSTISLIMDNLASTGCYEFVGQEQTRRVDYCDTFKVSFCPTRNYVWTPNKSKLICYQLDGNWKAEEKNLTHDETRQLFRFLRKVGYELIDVGNMRPLHDSIRLLSRAEAFIGIPSGMSHVNNSVGTPAYIICKPSFDRNFHTGCIYYRKPNVRLFDGVQDLTDYLFRISQNFPGVDYIPML
jgi:hypothetical protein